jgi:hypothetical protein
MPSPSLTQWRSKLRLRISSNQKATLTINGNKSAVLNGKTIIFPIKK